MASSRVPHKTAVPFYYEVWWLASGNCAGTATTPESLLDIMGDEDNLAIGVVVNGLPHFTVGPERVPWFREELTRMIAIHDGAYL